MAKKNTAAKTTKVKKIRATNEIPVEAAPVETDAADAAPEKAAKPKKEKKPVEPMKTFAFRMRSGDSDALHKAAGPRNASNVMLKLADAFVREDRAAFEEIVEEARKLRA